MSIIFNRHATWVLLTAISKIAAKRCVYERATDLDGFREEVFNGYLLRTFPLNRRAPAQQRCVNTGHSEASANEVANANEVAALKGFAPKVTFDHKVERFDYKVGGLTIKSGAQKALHKNRGAGFTGCL